MSIISFILFADLIRTNNLIILNALTTEAAELTFTVVRDNVIIIPTSVPITTKKSNRFQLSLKYFYPCAIIFMIASMLKTAAKK